MNEADIRMLEAQATSMAASTEILRLLMTIHRDITLLSERVESIERMMHSPPGAWPGHDDVELSDPPF